MSDITSEAVLGTDDYHATMRVIARNALQQQAGYVAPTMDTVTDGIMPVEAEYLERVDPIMQTLADDETLTGCNPRVPYLMFAWILVGSDNPYRKYVEDTSIIERIAITHLRIALGNAPCDSVIDALRDEIWAVGQVAAWAVGQPSLRDAVRATLRDAAWAVGHAAVRASLRDAVRVAIKASLRDALRDAVRSKALSLAHITDAQALNIARQLILDILKARNPDE
jgi:hypothetical protein